MLNHTKKIKEIYEDIQRRLFYMIPEKWDKLYLYSSVIDMPDGRKTGELYFYYTPKGILKKKPVNVYEIPNKFNLDEEDYIKIEDCKGYQEAGSPQSAADYMVALRILDGSGLNEKEEIQSYYEANEKLLESFIGE